MAKTVAVLSGLIRPLVESRLPEWIDSRWFMTKEEALALAPEAEIGWFDMHDKEAMAAAISAATQIKWLNSIYAGVDGLPLDLLHTRGVTFTNGAGINAITIAEYVIMGMLNIAKGFREVVRAQDRHEWLQAPPGRVELNGSTALIIGYGAIGALVHQRLVPFGVACSVVRRSRGGGVLGMNDWQDQIGAFDWIILSLPATAETEHLIGARELAAMKPTASIINVSRGSIIDQDALVEALRRKQIGHAFLDVTSPEPLPPEHPLWSLDNAHISMHLSGQSQDKMFIRSADRFIENLARYQSGEPLSPVVDYALGY